MKDIPISEMTPERLRVELQNSINGNSLLKARIASLEEDVRQRGALELDATAVILELKAELAKHEWVDKNERLPEEGQNVLIFGHERHHGVPFSAIWDWKSKNAFNTHWKPITIPTQPCQGYCSSCLTVDCKDRTEPKEQSNE